MRGFFRITPKKLAGERERERAQNTGLNKRDFCDGLNAGRKWLWSSSLTLIFFLCLLQTHTHIHTHTHPPSFSLIHSLTLGDALLHSSLPGAVKKARETHKSKLKCSSECFLDMMHGSWDAAWPCCYTCKCAETHTGLQIQKNIVFTMAAWKHYAFLPTFLIPYTHFLSWFGYKSGVTVE